MASKRNRPKRPQPPPAAPSPPAAPTPAAAARAERRRAERGQRAELIRSERARDAAVRDDGPVREPAFWFGFALPWAKLVSARVVVFGLLAIDAILQIRHAPRYGAGGFNVGQLPGLGALAPGQLGYELGQLIAAYLFALIACGVATRALVPISAAIYAWLYFTSQLDSYQHHYLVALVLAIACFVPWQRPPDGEPPIPVRSWALRLLLIQLAIVYLWAAISKLDPLWLDGRTLAGQLTGALRALVDRTIGLRAASVAVIAVELALAATIWWRRGWPIAAPLGVLFHVGIVVSGLEIGLFAFLMLGLYVLVIPDRIVLALAAAAPARWLSRAVDRARALAHPALWAIAIAGGLALAIASRLPHATAVAAAACAVPIGLALHARRRGAGPALAATAAAAHLLALGLWLAVDRASTVVVDYHRFWGGSQRRLGNFDEAARAYGALVELAPGDGRWAYQLGRVLLAAERGDDGLARLHDAQRLEPDRARAWIEEARWLARKGRIEEATRKARAATTAEPASAEARALLTSLSSGGPVPAARPAAGVPDDDTEAP